MAKNNYLCEARCQFSSGRDGVAVLNLLLGVLLMIVPIAIAAADADAEDEFDTDEPALSLVERREAIVEAREWALSSWASAYAEVEWDWAEQRFTREDASHATTRERSALFKLGLNARASEALTTAVTLEYDTDDERVVIDEFTVNYEAEDFEFVFGKQTLPFTELYSYFPTDPILEFGETTETAASVFFSPQDRFELFASAYDGDARRKGDGGSAIDGVLGFNVRPTSRFRFGMALQSDLADSDARLLSEEMNRFESKVAGLTLNMLYVGERFEVSFEALGALSRFDELSAAFDRPRTFNTELALFRSDRTHLALRYERTWELEDEPRNRYGVALAFLPHPNVEIGLEWMQGRFDRGATASAASGTVNGEGAEEDADGDEEEDSALRRVRYLGATIEIRF